jgi:hypothetical protein
MRPRPNREVSNDVRLGSTLDRCSADNCTEVAMTSPGGMGAAESVEVLAGELSGHG